MSDIVWEEPPTDAPGLELTRDQMWAKLRERPGAWARMEQGVRASNAKGIRTRRRREGYEVDVRETTSKDGDAPVYGVWGRWPA